MDKYKNYAILAKKALEEYDILYEDLSFLIEETNIFFLVTTKTKKYALKIFQEESSKLEDNLLEALLLREVSQRTNIIVPSIVPSKNKEEIIFVHSELFDTPKRVAVYNFIEGEDFDQKETDALFNELGRVIARLHQATREIEVPTNLVPKKWDQVFYYREEVPLYHKEEYIKFFKEEDVRLYDKFITYLNKMLPTYYIMPSYLIHADINPWNIKLFHNEIRLLDFEEGMEGTIVHEMAIMLFYYRYDPNYDYKKIKMLVFSGYEEVEKLPEITDFDLDLLIMARTANFINYVLILYDDPTEYIEARIGRIREFIREYQIKI